MTPITFTTSEPQPPVERTHTMRVTVPGSPFCRNATPADLKLLPDFVLAEAGLFRCREDILSTRNRRTAELEAESASLRARLAEAEAERTVAREAAYCSAEDAVRAAVLLGTAQSDLAQAREELAALREVAGNTSRYLKSYAHDCRHVLPVSEDDEADATFLQSCADDLDAALSKLSALPKVG
jgi:Mg2+ and Co2+ transporter CorA